MTGGAFHTQLEPLVCPAPCPRPAHELTHPHPPLSNHDWLLIIRTHVHCDRHPTPSNFLMRRLPDHVTLPVELTARDESSIVRITSEVTTGVRFTISGPWRRSITTSAKYLASGVHSPRAPSSARTRTPILACSDLTCRAAFLLIASLVSCFDVRYISLSFPKDCENTVTVCQICSDLFRISAVSAQG